MLKPAVAPQLRLKTTALIARDGEALRETISLPHPISQLAIVANVAMASSSCKVCFIRPTLELSGGEAVRLERVVRHHNARLLQARENKEAYQPEQT